MAIVVLGAMLLLNPWSKWFVIVVIVLVCIVTLIALTYARVADATVQAAIEHRC